MEREGRIERRSQRSQESAVLLQDLYASKVTSPSAALHALQINRHSFV